MLSSHIYWLAVPDGVATDWLATGAGIIVVILLEVSSVIPFAGDFLAIGFLLTRFGAVVLTYFGLRQFEPVALPEWDVHSVVFARLRSADPDSENRCDLD